MARLRVNATPRLKGGDMIEKEKIDSIKPTVDMVAFAQAKGVKMKKNDKSYFGLCPIHFL